MVEPCITEIYNPLAELQFLILICLAKIRR